MSKEIFIHFGITGASDTYKYWNKVLTTTSGEKIADLLTPDQKSTGWSFHYDDAANSSASSTDAVGEGNKWWVDETIIHGDSHYLSSAGKSSPHKMHFAGLDDKKRYTLYISAIHASAGRDTWFSVDRGSTWQIHDPLNNYTDPLVYRSIQPVDGVIDLWDTQVVTYAIWSAMWLIEEVSDTSIDPAFIRNRGWTKQPPAGTPLDRINPLTHGLVFAANIFGPRIETYPSNKLVEAIGISTLPTTSGTFANLDTNTDYISFANDSIPDFVANGQDFSVLLYCQDGTLVGSNQRILQRTEDATNVDGFSITENSDTGDLRWTVRKTDVQSQIDSNSALSKTEPTVLIGTAKFISGTDYDLVFWHGALKSTATAATAIGVGDNDTFFIGKRRDTSDNPWVGAAGLLVVWDRVLADAEATALVQNPWQIFKPRNIYIGTPPKRKVVVY